MSRSTLSDILYLALAVTPIVIGTLVILSLN